MVRRNFKEAMKYTTYNDRGVYVHVAVKFPLGSPDACSSSSNFLRKKFFYFFFFQIYFRWKNKRRRRIFDVQFTHLREWERGAKGGGRACYFVYDQIAWLNTRHETVFSSSVFLIFLFPNKTRFLFSSFSYFSIQLKRINTTGPFRFSPSLFLILFCSPF